MKNSNPPPCPGCNGTGQMTWFGGVSRFQFSYTDCPECNGVGFLDTEPDDTLQSSELTINSTLTSSQADDFLKALARILSETLSKDEKIQLRGFGSFYCSASASSQQKNICFSPSKKLQQKLKSPPK